MPVIFIFGNKISGAGGNFPIFQAGHEAENIIDWLWNAVGGKHTQPAMEQVG